MQSTAIRPFLPLRFKLHADFSDKSAGLLVGALICQVRRIIRYLPSFLLKNETVNSRSGAGIQNVARATRKRRLIDGSQLRGFSKKITDGQRRFLAVITAHQNLCAGITLDVCQKRRAIGFHGFRVHRRCLDDC